jgi:hypothetical protein
MPYQQARPKFEGRKEMDRKPESSVEDLFKHFREQLVDNAFTAESSSETLTIAAAVLTVAAVIQNSPAGRVDLLRSAIELAARR